MLERTTEIWTSALCSKPQKSEISDMLSFFSSFVLNVTRLLSIHADDGLRFSLDIINILSFFQTTSVWSDIVKILKDHL